MTHPKVQQLAAHCFVQIDEGQNLHQVLDSTDTYHLNANEKSLLIDCVYGTQRFKGCLIHLLKILLKRPISNAQCHALLCVALYRLIYTRNAPYAVVNDAVNIAKTIEYGRFATLVNAILRRTLREKDDLLTQVQKDNVARYNFPNWWINRLKKDYPNDAERIIDLSTEHPPMTLRVNCRKTTAENYQLLLQNNNIDCTILSPSALCLKQPVGVGQLPHFHEGWVSVQDFGAQQAVPLLDIHQGERVLDACAAPGGKTGHILEYADCNLTALDISSNRLQQVADNLKRLQFSATLKACDAAHKNAWFDGKLFDAILADVPCTASGVVRRNPDIKWRRRANDAWQTAQQQLPMLDTLWSCLKPNGRMLLATCSIFHEENQDQASAFLQRHPDARLRLEKILLPDSFHDGFYYALLDKAD